MSKLDNLVAYLAARAAEPGTWQGIAFFLGAAGSRYGANLDIGACAFAGATVSGVIKILLPDAQPPKESP